MSTSTFAYEPSEHEAERASNSYLMSLIAVMAGLPIPIINLFATLFFYIGNRNGTYFVRWHCTQALLSQVSLLFMNSVSFWWTVRIIFSDEVLSSDYFAYMITVIVFNVADFVMTIYTAVQTRQGKHIHWWLYGDLTNLICKETT